MNWTIFAGIDQQITQPLQTAVTSVAGQFLSAINSGPVLAAVTVFLAILGYAIAAGRVGEPFRDPWLQIARAGLVAFLVGTANYNQYVTNLFLTQIPNDISSALGGSGAVSASVFDQIWNKSYGAGLSILKNASWFDFSTEILVVAFWFAAAISIGIAFLLWMIGKLLLGLFVAVGPVVVPMFLFSALRSIFERWIGALISALFLMIFTVVLLTVLTQAETGLLASVKNAGTSGNAQEQVQVLFSPLILFLIVALVLTQIPGAATALAGGLHFHAHQISSRAFGTAHGAVQGAARGARQIAGGGAAAMGRVVGRSMSFASRRSP